MPSICEVDARTISGEVDRPLSEWTPESLRQCFMDRGCAIVRRAVPVDLLGQVRDAVEAAYQTTTDVHVYDRDIKAVTRRALTGFELVGDPKFKRFLDLIYRGQFHMRKNATGRRIAPPASTSFGQSTSIWQEPLALHIDSQFHRPQFTVNFWIPFQDCGIDAAALQVVPIDYILTRGYSGYTGRALRGREDFYLTYFAEGVFEIDAVRDAFGEHCLLRPVLQAGDLIVASNWLIHGSYRTPTMVKGRSSIELRFIGTDLDIFPYLAPLAGRMLSAVSGRSKSNFARRPILDPVDF